MSVFNSWIDVWQIGERQTVTSGPVSIATKMSAILLADPINLERSNDTDTFETYLNQKVKA